MVEEGDYPAYSKTRDGDMLRSEHIPFNLFAPFMANVELARRNFQQVFKIDIAKILDIRIEYSPEPKEKYLDDATAFDVYVLYQNGHRELAGIGIEVKYTEKAYKMGKTEGGKVRNHQSKYWKVTRASTVFRDDSDPLLASDDLRQIWRNHLLGLAMIQAGDIKSFHSIILFPNGNQHFHKVIPEYQGILVSSGRDLVQGLTYEAFIEAIDGEAAILKWKNFLKMRYLV